MIPVFAPPFIPVSSASFDAATTAWVAAVVSNGGSVSNGRKSTVNALITSLKSDGIWTKLDRLWILAAENAPSALTDMVALSLATEQNSPTFTTDRGYAGDGATSYIETGYAPDPNGVQYTLNAASISVWSNTDRAAANYAATGAITGGYVADLWPYTAISSPTGVLTRINDSFTVVTGTSSLGMFTINRSGASACEVYRNGSSLGTTTDAAVGLPQATFAILSGQNSIHALNAPGTDQISAAAYGGSLSSTDAGNFYTRMRTYMTAVGVP